MTLFRQLFLASSLLFLALLAGVEAVYLANARVYLEQQLASQSQDAATSLAISLGSRGSISSPGLVETAIKPVFDRGYFASIRVATRSGDIVAQMELPVLEGDVPAWFVKLLPLRTQSSESIISSGWNELGRVAVVSHPYFVYLQLWHTGLQTLTYLAILFLLALICLRIFLRGILRPLLAIEETAAAIADRNFRTVGFIPRTRELKSVVLAMNSLSAKIQRAIAEESARAEQLRTAAYEDPVTGLYTRRGLEQEFANIVVGGREVYSGVLALLQLDDLKEINERHGRAHADELLARVARAILEACATRTVLTSRLTGADFAIAAINLDHAAAVQMLSDIEAHVRACLAGEFTSEGIRFYCGAAYFDSGALDLSALFSSADLALARARERDSGSVEFISTKDIRGPVRSSQEWRETIESALAADRLLLYAQPVMRLPGRDLLHHEILVRLVDDAGNVIPAAGFIPMVARHGMLPRLDLAIVQKLCAQLKAGAPSRIPIAINIAAQTIDEPTTLEQLLGLLRSHPAAASRFVFEMTEFGATRNLEATRAFASHVRALGAGFAIDNFGLHRAVLSQLPVLLPTYVKLAAEFARGIIDSDDTRFLIMSLARIAQPLDILLIAQAVENESELKPLQELGIDGYQGYISGQPAPLQA